MNTQEDDYAVIHSVLQGNQSAFATLVVRYRQYVFSLVLRYIPERELAEEIAQDVFVKAFRSLSTFRGDSKFSTWLYTIVHTTCLSQLRKKKSNAILLEEETLIALYDNREQHLPTNKLEQDNLKLAINKALQHLPEIDAQVLSLFYLAAQSVEEVATITGMTTTNVKVRLYRARQKLKEIIEHKYTQELMK